MVEVPDALSTLFSAQIETDGDRYIVEIPNSRGRHGAVSPGETYRVGLLSQATPVRRQQPTADAQTGHRPGTSQHRRPATAVAKAKSERDHRSLGDQGDGIAKVDADTSSSSPTASRAIRRPSRSRPSRKTSRSRASSTTTATLYTVSSRFQRLVTAGLARLRGRTSGTTGSFNRQTPT